MTNVLDDIAPAFKEAAIRWPDAQNFQTHYSDLASTFESNGSSLIELCKSFLEAVCITVLNEMGAITPPNGSTTQYVVAALDALGLRNTRGASAFDKVLSAHNKLADALTEVRNHEGSVAHGKDGFIDAMSDRHARVYLLSADTIISLVLQAFDGKEPSLLKTRERHDRYLHLNNRINSATQIKVNVDEEGIVELSFRAGTLNDGFDIRVSVSELLYYLDRQAYVDVLDALRGVTIEAHEEEIPEPEEAEAKPAEESQLDETADEGITLVSKKLQPVTMYDGKYKDLVSPLYDYILHSNLGGNMKFATQIQNFTYTILYHMEDMAVIDWSNRPSTRTKVRLFLKKLVKLFSIEDIKGKNVDEVVTWLGQRIAGGEE